MRRLRADLVGVGAQRWPRGAVGAHARDGRALYAYPEIAGYWLQWASARADVDRGHGEAVIAWLAGARRDDGAWPARVGCAVDFHADAVYLYDHTMLWQGLRCWARARRSAAADALAGAAWQVLARFHVDGRWRPAFGAAPARWSGQGGPFLLKALVRLRNGGGALADAARAAIPALAAEALATPHRQAHPQLYAIEGLLLLGDGAAARAAFDALLCAHGGADRLHEQDRRDTPAHARGPQRHDVLAQALRIAHWLAGPVDTGPSSDDGAVVGAAGRRENPLPQACRQVADELAAAIGGDGRIAFAPGADHCPTWTALFAEQALALHAGERIAVEDLV
ncbi:MAG: hypothetical protein AMXMBFR25_05760 [Lysobacterales bacterium]